MMTHKQNVLVSHDLAQPLALLYHGGWLVASVPGAPAQEPAGVLVDHLQAGVLEAAQRCGVGSVGVLRVINSNNQHSAGSYWEIHRNTFLCGLRLFSEGIFLK